MGNAMIILVYKCLDSLLLGRVLYLVLRLLGSLASPFLYLGMGMSIREFSRVEYKYRCLHAS